LNSKVIQEQLDKKIQKAENKNLSKKDVKRQLELLRSLNKNAKKLPANLLANKFVKI